MRKVIFQYWIYPVKKDIANGRSVETTTGGFSEPQSGYFHGWGFESVEDSTTMVMHSVALVEHCTTGYMHNVQPEKMRFVTPPETKDNWYKEFQKDKHVNDAVPYLSGKMENGLHIWGVDNIIEVKDGTQRIISIKELEAELKRFGELKDDLLYGLKKIELPSGENRDRVLHAINLLSA